MITLPGALKPIPSLGSVLDQWNYNRQEYPTMISTAQQQSKMFLHLRPQHWKTHFKANDVNEKPALSGV